MPDGNRINDLQDQLLDLNEQAQTVQAKADAEKRELSEDERTELDRIFARFEEIEDEIDRRQRIASQTEKLAAVHAPKVDHGQPRAHSSDIDSDQPAEPQASRPRVPRIDIIADKGKGGWHTFGHFASAVRAACRHGGMVDPRLVANAPSTYGSEGVGADGGFAVPPDFRAAIMEKVMGEESLLARTDQMTTASNNITFPSDETTPWQTTGGIQTYWVGEGSQITQSKPALKEVNLRLHKLAALVPVTEELLEDAPTLGSYLSRRVPIKLDFALSLAILQGTGAGQPLGILNSDCLVTVAKRTAGSPDQSADTVEYPNIVEMWSRMYGPCRSRAVWLINQDVEPQLHQMRFPDANVTQPVPAYMPAGGLSSSPYATLMGRPVIPTQACETLGDKGDIVLADLSQYMTVMKAGGIRQDVSMHLWFDYDVQAFRFIMRIAGQPWWSSSISPRDGTNTLSCFVTLAERA